MNTYGYVGGNPLKWIDSLGLAPDDIYRLRPYDKSHPYYHYYERYYNICKLGGNGCTPENVYEVVKRYPAPGFNCKNTVQHGDQTEIKFMGLSGGSVVHLVDDSNRTVYNLTGSNHIFYDGHVSRTVIIRGNNVVVRTVGEGTNQSALNTILNMRLYKPGFDALDSNIKSYVEGNSQCGCNN